MKWMRYISPMCALLYWVVLGVFAYVVMVWSDREITCSEPVRILFGVVDLTLAFALAVAGLAFGIVSLRWWRQRISSGMPMWQQFP